MPLYSDVQSALRAGDHARVEDLLAPIMANLRTISPTASIALEVKAPSAVIRIHAQGGPSGYAYTSEVSDLLGCTSNYQDDITGGEIYGWSGVYLTLELRRSHPPVSYGLAVLAATLAGSCFKCDTDSSSEAPYMVFLECLEQDRAHLLSAHPGLVALTQWGVDSEEIMAMAELLGAMRSPQGDAYTEHKHYQNLFHESGHLSGLREMNALLSA